MSAMNAPVFAAFAPGLFAVVGRIVSAISSRYAISSAVNFPGVPVTDTVKRAPGDDLRVVETLDRSALWAVQTPQVFRRDALARALAQPDELLASATDDAGLVEQAGGRVHVVESPADNLKVTTPTDLRLAEILLRERLAC